jgi:hypothetical protein
MPRLVWDQRLAAYPNGVGFKIFRHKMPQLMLIGVGYLHSMSLPMAIWCGLGFSRRYSNHKFQSRSNTDTLFSSVSAQGGFQDSCPY